MKSRMKVSFIAAFLLAALVCGKTAFAQAQGTPPAAAPPASDKPKTDAGTAPLTIEPLVAPVNAEEDAAIKGFRDAPLSDVPKKLQLGNDFLAKYPDSRYRVEVFSWQVKGYLSTGQVDKMQEAGEKELKLDSTDAQTLAILGSTLPRTLAGSMSEEQKQKILAQAEEYSKKALELVPTLPKPGNITDEQFTSAKNQVQAMAYGGLGLVAFRRSKFTEAIPNLEKSTKLDPNPDPVNYFLLGVSNEKASHFDDAAAAFAKCAAIPSSLQTNCKSGVDEAKKLGATQLSVPK